MNKKIIYVVVFFLCLAVPLAAHFIAPDKTFSDNENRMLAKRPSLSTLLNRRPQFRRIMEA